MFTADLELPADFDRPFTDVRDLAEFLLSSDHDDDIGRGDEQSGLVYVVAKNWLKTYCEYQMGTGLNGLNGAWDYFFDGLAAVPEVEQYIESRHATDSYVRTTIILMSIAQAAMRLVVERGLK